jgi:hypothetical protein
VSEICQRHNAFRPCEKCDVRWTAALAQHRADAAAILKTIRSTSLDDDLENELQLGVAAKLHAAYSHGHAIGESDILAGAGSAPRRELQERLDVTRASRDALLVALEALVATLTGIGGYMTPEQQAELRNARALLAEEGV